MKTRILTVDETFLIQGRGLVIVGRKTNEFVNFKTGDTIELETAGESFLKTKIVGLEFVCRRNFDENSKDFYDKLIGFMVEKEIKQTRISKGANIWLLDNTV
jgi:hypothetical protein